VFLIVHLDSLAVLTDAPAMRPYAALPHPRTRRCGPMTGHARSTTDNAGPREVLIAASDVPVA